jgi:hypothetical protein
MDIKRMLVDLRNERQRVDQAIAALEALDGTGARAQVAGKHRLVGTSQTTTQKRQSRRRMSAAGRKRISMMMKKRWAARRKAAKKA